MEILIKAKQTANSQFDFLNYDHFLNGYYKYLVELIKNGKYIPNIEDDKSESDNENENDNYLHPLLSRNIANIKTDFKKDENNTAKFKPNIKDSPYNELIEKFAAYS